MAVRRPSAPEASRASPLPGRSTVRPILELETTGHLPRLRRMLERGDFRHAQKVGQRFPTDHFVLIVAQRAASDLPARLGLTLSRKVGTAVRRNQLKRLTREVFRRGYGHFPEGMDYVVLFKPGTIALRLEDVVQSFSKVLPRVRKAMRSSLPEAKGQRQTASDEARR